ncbi:cytochrome P450 [Geminicoccus harenae]|uniref:cytochrome P450 n=1 Tax=Geminicoccus harenae TaxID=2498453 RepID=UPI00168C0220|nr:cytochrome P450 [Geminicoccus harenae]
MREGPLTFDPATRRVRLDPRDPDFFLDPYPTYRAIHAHCPVFFWEELGHWCLAGLAEVDAVMRDRRFGRDAWQAAACAGRVLPEIPGRLAPFYAVEACSMLEREPPLHTRLRSQVSRAFVPRRIEALRDQVQTLADRLVDAFPAGRPFDLLPAYCTPIPVETICLLLGVPAAMAPDLLDWSHRMVAMYRPGRSRADEDAAVAATLAFVAWLKALIRERRHRPGDDLISQLAGQDPAEGGLSEDELVSTCILLLNAGHEATVHALGNAVAVLLAQPGDPADRFATPEAAAATVEEVLRFVPPLHLFCRHALAEVELAGVKLRPGERIGLLLGAAGRDPRRFADPDRFDPGRADRRHVAFGAGIHACLGAALARLELQVALTTLFRRCPDLRLAAPTRCRDSWHFHGQEAVLVASAAGAQPIG